MIFFSSRLSPIISGIIPGSVPLHLNVKKQKAASSVSPVIGASLVNFVKTSTEVLPTPEIKVVAVKKSPWLMGFKS